MTDTRRRVKLYALNAERQWDDRGTGHVTSSYVERLKGVSLLVRAESDGQCPGPPLGGGTRGPSSGLRAPTLVSFGLRGSSRHSVESCRSETPAAPRVVAGHTRHVGQPSERSGALPPSPQD